MTDRAIVRLAEIAREYDQAGKPHHADIIEDAMIRLSQSAVGNFWNGLKQVGTGIVDDAKAAGNAIAMPFEGAAAGAKAAWDGGGLAYAPQAAGQAEEAAWDRAARYTQQEMQQYQQAAPALAGPSGTGLPGAVVQDTAHGLQNAAQGYVGGLMDQRVQAQQDAYVKTMLQKASQAHQTNGTGWQVIQNAVTYGNLAPEMQAKLKQEFAAAVQPGSH